jgi:protoporphyrinogen oxidase
MAALNLARRGIPVMVLEQADQPGGLAGGHRRGENFYDLGVHMLHAFDGEVFEIIKELMAEERIEVELNAKIRWGGKNYRYPLQFADMLRGMNPFTLLHCSLGLFATQLLAGVISEREPADAEEALIQLYGKPLYRFFFEEFTERYWGIHPRDLSAAFIKSKMPRLSAIDIIKRQLARFGFKERAGRAVESALLQETLHYSRKGAEAMPRRLAAAVEAAGGEVRLRCPVETVHLDEGGRACAVTVTNLASGAQERLEGGAIIATVPLPLLVTSLHPKPPSEVIAAAGNLRFKPIAVYGLLVSKEKAIDALYIYYRNYVFHRVGEPKNAGLEVTPSDHTLLLVEMTCEEGDAKWRGDQSIMDQIYRDLEAEGICTREQVVETHVLNCATGYPIFDRGFEPFLETIRQHLAAVPNLRSVGRQGGFCYPNMHQAMRMGMDAAAEIAAMRDAAEPATKQ